MTCLHWNHFTYNFHNFMLLFWVSESFEASVYLKELYCVQHCWMTQFAAFTNCLLLCLTILQVNTPQPNTFDKNTETMWDPCLMRCLTLSGHSEHSVDSSNKRARVLAVIPRAPLPHIHAHHTEVYIFLCLVTW